MLKVFITFLLIVVLSVIGLNVTNMSALIVIFSIVVLLALILGKMLEYEKKKYDQEKRR